MPRRLLLLALLLTAGCDVLAAVGTSAPAVAPVTFSTDPAEIAFDGVVTYTIVEGGAWVLRDDAGETYGPINLPASYRAEGLRVHVEADVRENMGSVRQVGPIIELLQIAPLDR